MREVQRAEDAHLKPHGPLADAVFWLEFNADGSICEGYLWDRVLTPEEIAEASQQWPDSGRPEEPAA